MKVNQHIPVQSQPLERASQTNKSSKTQATLDSRSPQNAQLGGASVEISPEAQLMKQASEIAKNAPDLRLDKVEQLKKSIKEGSYQIESSKIADRLVEDHLKNHFGKSHL